MLWLLGIGTLYADCERELAQYRLQTWQTEDGLPLDAVYSLGQTADDFIWIGTEAGLARFDGAEFVRIDLSSVLKGAVEHLPVLATSPTGHLLAGSRSPGLLRIEPHEVTMLPLDVTVGAILPTDDGTLWLGTRNDGLWVRPAPGARIERIAGTRSRWISALALRKEGGIWIGYGDAGVQYINGRDVFDIGPRAASLGVLALQEDEEGQLWIGTREGLFKHDAETVSPVTQIPEAVAALMLDQAGNLWVGLGDGGLERLCSASPANMDALSEANGLPPGPIKDLFQARDGSVWVATHGGGVARLTRGTVLPIMSDQGLPHRPVLPLLQHHDGRMIAGTFGAGIVIIDTETYRVLSTVEGLPNQHVFSLAHGHDGGFWAGTRNGIAFIRDGKVVRKFSDRDGLPSSTTMALLRGKDKLWIGTSAGLASLDGATITRYGSKSGRKIGPVVQMHLDRHSRLWVGTDGDGLYQLENGTLVRPAFYEDMPSAHIFGFHQTDSALWILTTRGLVQWDGKQLRTVAPSNGLPEPQLHAMLDDGHGHFWISGNLGVFRVDKEDLRSVARDGGTLQTVRRFTQGDGMPRSETNGGFQPAAAKSPDGHLWYPTSDGIAVFDPSDALDSVQEPSIVLTEIAIGNTIVGPAERLSLPPNPLAIRIQYTAPEFTFPERLSFRYRLSGLEPNWYTTTERQVLFHKLPPGDMRFEVQARVGQGPWSDSATVSLTVARHLFQSPWFWLTLAAAFTGALLAGYAWWQNQRLARLKQLQQAQKLESVGLLASGIAHDFKNVLQNTIGYIEILRTELTPGSQAWDDAGQALDSANNGVGIAQQLLTFARREPGNPKPVLLHQELEQMAPFLNRLVPPSVKLEIPQLDNVGVCVIDPVQLQQVMLNLVTNARDAMPDGGVVQISLNRADGQRARIRVADTGEGIPAAALDRIYEPFFTTKSEGTGTGLGLAVTYGIVKDAGGHIEVDSSTVGTTFDVVLPVTPESAGE